MSKEIVLDRLERLAVTVQKFEGFLDKIPRVVGMLGTAYFAGKASQRVGGPFELGALSGAVAHDLAHSQLPNNQFGGIALAAYLSAVGLLNLLPFGIPTVPPLVPDPDDPAIVGAGGTVLDPKNVYSGLEENEEIMQQGDCLAAGGTIVRHFTKSALVVCALPPPVPVEIEPIFTPIDRPIRPGGIRR